MREPLARERVTYIFFVADATKMDSPTLVHLRGSPGFRAFLERGYQDIGYTSTMVPGGLDVTVTFLLVAGMGSPLAPGAPANVSGWAGPRRLVAKVWTSCWRSKVQRSSPAGASSRNDGPSSAADVPRAAVLRSLVIAAIRVTRASCDHRARRIMAAGRTRAGSSTGSTSRTRPSWRAPAGRGSSRRPCDSLHSRR